MVIKIVKPIVLACYALLVLFLGEFIMILYSRSTMQMHLNNSVGRKRPESYVMFHLVLLILAHVAMIALNLFVWYALSQYVK